MNLLTMTMDLFWLIRCFWPYFLISLHLGFIAYVSSPYIHVFLMLFFFLFPQIFFINAKREKYCMIALFLLLAFVLNVTFYAQTKGKNLGLKLKLSHKIYKLFTLHVCNHFVCRYQKGEIVGLCHKLT